MNASLLRRKREVIELRYTLAMPPRNDTDIMLTKALPS